MVRNYLITAFRNLRKNRLYSFITVGGLAVGLAACILILLFVRDELSYDEWLPDAERIAKVEITFKIPGRDPMSMGQAPGPVRAALQKDFSSDIQAVARVWRNNAPIRSGDKQFNDDISYVDANFFDIFDLPMVAGQREQALADNASILLSQTTARKYFGDGAAVGQVMTVDNKLDFKVVGVFADMPRNSHLDFDLIALFDTKRYTDYPWIAETWTSTNTHVYALFRSPDAIATVQSELVDFTNRNVVFDIPGFKDATISDFVEFNLMPVLDIHLHARKEGYVKPGGDITTVFTFSAIALLILLIACVNFVNLATARSMVRAREVAMRKVVGATRSQLVSQFLGEALMIALIALVLACAMVELALGSYNSFLDKELTLGLATDPTLGLILIGLVVVVGLIGGIYPAFYLSRFRPARVLKANQSSASGGTWMRNTLVVFQFVVSIALIISTSIVYAQTRYARTLDLGFATSNRLVLGGLGDMPGENGESALSLERAVDALPEVVGTSLASDAPPLQNNNNTILFQTPTPGDDQIIVETMRVDANFFPLYNVKPIAGRLFSNDLKTDAVITPEDKSLEATQSIVVNETFVRDLKIASPEQAIGMTFWAVDDPKDKRMVRTTVIGVVADLHLRSVNFTITPMLYTFRTEPNQFNRLAVKVKPGEMSAALAAIEPIWNRMAPGVPIRTMFVDQNVAAQYDSVERRGHMFGAFALFAVLIACLGLFGLASFSAERRIKEIGVRKALGASVLDIVRLLMWQFSKPVLIANLIAWPAAFYVMNRWLATFKYRLDITDPLLLIGIFGGAGLIAIAIAWATVAGQATRVARASPINALRCE